MDAINNFLRNQSDKGVGLYNQTSVVALAVMLLVVIFYLVRMNVFSANPIGAKAKILHAAKGLLFAVVTYYFMFPAQHFMMWYRHGFDPADFTANVANIALGYTLLPLLAFLLAKTFNTSTGYAGDMVALTAFSYHVIGRSGCLFRGCCYGFFCDWGWYSHDAADAAVYDAINNNTALPGKDAMFNTFPVSLVESLFTLAILVFVLVRICRKNYVPDGKNLPYFLFFYGICRFFSELTRESTKDSWFLWRFSDVHIHMLLMATIGFAMLYYIRKKEKAAVAPAEDPLPTLKGQRH